MFAFLARLFKKDPPVRYLLVRLVKDQPPRFFGRFDGRISPGSIRPDRLDPFFNVDDARNARAWLSDDSLAIVSTGHADDIADGYARDAFVYGREDEQTTHNTKRSIERAQVRDEARDAFVYGREDAQTTGVYHAALLAATADTPPCVPVDCSSSSSYDCGSSSYDSGGSCGGSDF